jgi:hypothetical protein
MVQDGHCNSIHHIHILPSIEEKREEVLFRIPPEIIQFYHICPNDQNLVT